MEWATTLWSSQCGYLESPVEADIAKRWKMQGCLPTLSGPLYETLHTALSPIEHGILSNDALRASTVPNIFNLLNDSGHVTAALAHSFFPDLYCGRTYNVLDDIEIDDPALAIQHGCYYSMDSPEYRRQAWTSDNALARVMPNWLDLGYQIFVTADHGMNIDGQHGGNESLTRDVAFYYFGQQPNTVNTNEVLDQRRVAPTIFQSLGADATVFALPGILQV